MKNYGLEPIPKWKPKKDSQYLNDELANYPERSNPEADVFHISFSYYNEKECEITHLEKNRAKEALSNLKVIGKCYDLSSLQANGIDIIKVRPAGDYKKLFTKKVTDDVELREHKVQGESRLFYFISEKLFNIVAITNSHYETSKNK